jgi:hypothetical protein
MIGHAPPQTGAAAGDQNALAGEQIGRERAHV